MEKLYTIEQIRAIVEEIAARHNAGRTVLFGSRARGKAAPGSDLDFCAEKGLMRDMFDLGAFYADLRDAFEVPVDLVTTDSLSPEELRRAQAEGIVLYDPRRP